jgi:dTDP-4-amino-4,6-dideoxygalactose transaminase
MTDLSDPGARPPLDLTAQEPIPPAGVQAALAVMASGKLHRYGETGPKPGEVSLLEAEFARHTGRRYCVALNSCGSAMFVALKALRVGPGDAVLANAFTLAPVPGAIVHTGAQPVLVDITDHYTIDLDDLARKAANSGARVLLLSHMRGHIADMARVIARCRELGLTLVEDCAHTMGAGWDGRLSGTFGVAGCFSLQSYKHANAGEGGLLVTDDADLAAQAILMSGSYALYGAHLVRPDEAVLARWAPMTPNFSLRMSNLAAAVARPQLDAALRERGARWNQRYRWLVQGLAGTPGLTVPPRDPREQFIASSLQFSLSLPAEVIARFVSAAAQRGVHVKWFGAAQPAGFTSVWRHWQFLVRPQHLPCAERVLAGLCDLRLPLTLSEDDCRRIAADLRAALSDARAAPTMREAAADAAPPPG